MKILTFQFVLAEAEKPHGVDLCPAWIVSFFEWVQTASDLAGISAITFGFFGAVGFWLWGEIRAFRGKEQRWRGIEKARLFLGRYILLGLELMIVSDLIHSFLKPDLESLYVLGLVVVIRTAISFFLGKELEAVVVVGVGNIERGFEERPQFGSSGCFSR